MPIVDRNQLFGQFAKSETLVRHLVFLIRNPVMERVRHAIDEDAFGLSPDERQSLAQRGCLVLRETSPSSS